MGTARSYRFSPDYNVRWAAIKQQMIACNPDILLHGGDFTRDGDTHEYEYQMTRDDMMDLPFPTFAIPGNMDVGNKHTDRPSRNRDDVKINMTSERLRLYSQYFGPPCWSFRYRDVRFTGFYAAVTGSGLPEEDHFWALLDAVRRAPREAQHVVVMHYWLFINSPDEGMWDITDPDQYHNWYFNIDPEPRKRIIDWMHETGVTNAFSGHVHTGRPVYDLDGIRYYRTSAAGNMPQLVERWPDSELRAGFHRCDVRDGEIDVRFIPCDALDEAQAAEANRWGPGGHPTLIERDYSIATEKPPLQPDPWLL
jgi:hypothetical protein